MPNIILVSSFEFVCSSGIDFKIVKCLKVYCIFLTRFVVDRDMAACEVVQPHTAAAIAEVAAVCKEVNRQMTRCQRDQMKQMTLGL